MREIFWGVISGAPNPALQQRARIFRACRHLCLRPSCFFHTFAKSTAPSPLRQNHATRPSTSRKHLVTVLSKLGLDLAVDGRALLGVDELLLESPLALVVGRALDLSPLLEPGM